MKFGYLIAVDLDDTLVTDFDNYDKKSFGLLKKLSRDNYIVIATGRPYRSSKYFYDILELNTPIINYNGALIHHPTDCSFNKSINTIDKSIVIDLIKDNEDIVLNLFCEIEDEIFLWKESNEIQPYLHLDGGSLTIGNLETTLKGNPNGAIILSIPGSEDRLSSYLKQKYQSTINIRFWKAQKVVVAELYSPLTSKGHALQIIAKHYNIPNDKLIAIGDGHNDIEMISMAHIGVAMGNCHPELLNVANEITKSVTENGVYHFLSNFFETK